MNQFLSGCLPDFLFQIVEQTHLLIFSGSSSKYLKHHTVEIIPFSLHIRESRKAFCVFRLEVHMNFHTSECISASHARKMFIQRCIVILGITFTKCKSRFQNHDSLYTTRAHSSSMEVTFSSVSFMKGSIGVSQTIVGIPLFCISSRTSIRRLVLQTSGSRIQQFIVIGKRHLDNTFCVICLFHPEYLSRRIPQWMRRRPCWLRLISFWLPSPTINWLYQLTRWNTPIFSSLTKDISNVFILNTEKSAKIFSVKRMRKL